MKQINSIKKGQKVWAVLKNEIKETRVKSVGYKYITVEDIEILFDSKTLRRVGSGGSRYFIITNIEQYKKEQSQYYKKLIDKVNRLDWESGDKEVLDKIAKILR